MTDTERNHTLTLTHRGVITLLSLETDKDTDVSTPEYFISMSVRIEIVHSQSGHWVGGSAAQTSHRSDFVSHSHCHENIVSQMNKMKKS